MDHPDGATTMSLQEFVDALHDPVVVFDRHLDVVAANPIAGAVSASFTPGTNLARFTFLNPYVEDAAAGWELQAGRTTAALRDSLEQHDEDDRFRELVGELMARSSAFADQWAHGVVRPQRRGVSGFENPLVGRLCLAFEQFRRHDDPEHVVMVWVAADAETSERLDRLRAIIAAH